MNALVLVQLGVMAPDWRRPAKSRGLGMVLSQIERDVGNVDLKLVAFVQDEARALLAASPCACWWQHGSDAVWHGRRWSSVRSRSAWTTCAGEWLLEKYRTATRGSWRRLHLGVDAETGRIVAATLTHKDVDDTSQAGPLLGQVAGSVALYSGDGIRPGPRL